MEVVEWVLCGIILFLLISGLIIFLIAVITISKDEDIMKKFREVNKK